MSATTRTFLPGQTIFSEGDAPESAYVVVRGAVDISIKRDGKVITFDTVKKGQCFGEMGPLTGQPRSTSARAREVTELLVMPVEGLRETLNQRDPVARVVVQALIDRVRKLDNAAAEGFRSRVSMDSIARMLVLLSKAESHGAAQGKPSPNARASGPGGAAAPRGAGTEEMAQVGYDSAVEQLASVLGAGPYQIRALLDQMQDLNLLKLEQGAGASIRFRAAELVEHAARMEKSLGSLIDRKLSAENEFCDLDELAADLALDAEALLSRLFAGRAPKELFLFRRRLAQELARRPAGSVFG